MKQVFIDMCELKIACNLNTGRMFCCLYILLKQPFNFCYATFSIISKMRTAKKKEFSSSHTWFVPFALHEMSIIETKLICNEHHFTIALKIAQHKN